MYHIVTISFQTDIKINAGMALKFKSKIKNFKCNILMRKSGKYAIYQNIEEKRGKILLIYQLIYYAKYFK